MDFINPMVGQEPKTDFPVELDIDIDVFHKFKKSWLLWRSTGSFDAGGNFTPSISFLEARREIPKEELDLYFELDDLLAIRKRQVEKK